MNIAGAHARRLRLPASIALLLLTTAAVAAPSKRLSYRVDDKTYGPIGTYSFLVEPRGDATLITSEAHIRVTVLGITLFRQEAVRHERWVGARLVEFHGVTTEDGTPVRLDGRADGDQFVLVSPGGEVRAPGSIRPASPLTADAGGGPVFMPDTGVVTAARVDDLGDTTIAVGGTTSVARHYRIETTGGHEQYEVWMGPDRTPLRFTARDARSSSTFTLIE